MSRPIGVIPSNIPIDQAGNLVDPVWYLFFQQLYVRAGGAISQSNNELIAGQLDDAGIEESKAEIYALRDQITSMYTAVQALIDDLNNAPIVQQSYDYNPAAIQVTGGSITGVSIDSSSIGSATPSTGAFSTLTNGDTSSLVSSSVSLTNGAGAGVGTITNAPTSGNPAKWIPINDNGTVRYVPAW